jgi:hypothetical protein
MISLALWCFNPGVEATCEKGDDGQCLWKET